MSTFLKLGMILIAITLIIATGQGWSMENDQNQVPLSTRWLLDAAGETGRTAIKSVFMVVCPKATSKGTGFLLRNGLIVTNAHVLGLCNSSDVMGISSNGQQVSFNKVAKDDARDLALLFPSKPLEGGLLLSSDSDPVVGTALNTWGYPLGYNGPAPLLTVGYLSGFQQYGVGVSPQKTLKRIVVNGAFNPGNSGGPLFKANDDKVIGVVVNKHAPITPFLLSAIDALAENKSGIVFEAKDDNGNKKTFVESQVVAEILLYFRNMTQVVIGEAIPVTTLREFLGEQGIEE